MKFRLAKPAGGGGFTEFWCLAQSGDNVATGAWRDLGFSAIDRTGDSSYYGDLVVEHGPDVTAPALSGGALLAELQNYDPRTPRLWRIQHESIEERFRAGVSSFDVLEMGVDSPMQADFALSIAGGGVETIEPEVPEE